MAMMPCSASVHREGALELGADAAADEERQKVTHARPGGVLTDGLSEDVLDPLAWAVRKLLGERLELALEVHGDPSIEATWGR